MSFLTPLYILGALAIAAPIVFHLIRRAPKGEVPFSSLMFLEATPPRLTRRSRLDNWFLLLLRASALGLLALAFARPFLREAARLNFSDVGRRRVALLIDTSASMRRGDLWKHARSAAEAVIADCRPDDQLAVFAFDGSTRPLLSFRESETLDPSRRQAVARARLDELAPTWGATHLDQALIEAVAAIEDLGDAKEKAVGMPRHVVLISDLQQGGRLEALGNFEWPSDVELELKTVADSGSNAGLQWLAGPAEGAPATKDQDLRVGVSNDPGSKRESFELAWVDAKGGSPGKSIPVYVPPGESRVVRVPPPADASPGRVLRLTGDTDGFDNTLYLATEPRDDATVFYVGSDVPDDPAGLLYYLNRVFEDTPRRTVHVEAKSPASALNFAGEKSLPLVVLAGEATPENVGRLRAFMQGGGTLLDVIAAPGKSATLAALADVAPAGEIEAVARDLMLREVAFDHPLFAPFAGAQFNDFTKIHFWNHRRLDPAMLVGVRVLARFEDGDPALVEKPVGKGRLVVLTSGWNPADSQLARSTKFVPLMAGLLEGREPVPVESSSHLVGDRVTLPPGASAVRMPDGTSFKPEPHGTAFAETGQPGVYTIEMPGGPRSFAVNLDPAESKTAPLQVETLEQFGCRLASPEREAAEREHLRQMQSVELEGRQKLWRWLILAAIGVLFLETWLAGRLSRPRPARAEALAT
jgi:hypothetical protein